MSEKFQVGTVVCLKSGGPAMTVERGNIGPSAPVYCLWFNGEGLDRAEISEECLELDILIMDDDDDQEERVLSS